jgi:ABC-type transporter Mla subunit MlaD
MKKDIVITLAVSFAVIGMAYATASMSKGKVTAVDGKSITIQLDSAIGVKAGDAVKVEAVGSKAGFKLQGC